MDIIKNPIIAIIAEKEYIIKTKNIPGRNDVKKSVGLNPKKFSNLSMFLNRKKIMRLETESMVPKIATGISNCLKYGCHSSVPKANTQTNPKP